LTDEGYDFVFVGTSNEPWSLPFGPDFGLPLAIERPDLRTLGQDNHRGYGGITTSQLLNGPSASGSSNSFSDLAAMLNEDAPDIVLLLVGINGVAEAMSAIDPLVNQIFVTKPGVHLIIAQITPRSTYQQEIVDYNTYIADTLVPKYQGLGMKITEVDQYSNLLTNPTDKMSIDPSLFTDSAHLRPEAYVRLAKTWAKAIKEAKVVPAVHPVAKPAPAPVAETVPALVEANGEIAVPIGDGATFDLPVSLIEGLEVSYTGGGTPILTPEWADWAQMNDGVVGPAAAAPDQTMLLDNLIGPETPWAVWELDTSANPLGYDITSLQSFSGFTGERIWQNFEIKYALVGEQITHGEELAHVLGTFVYQPPTSGYNATKVTVEKGDQDGTMISGVSAIQIKYLDNGFNGNPDPILGGNFTSYREFSVVGKPTASAPF